MKNPGAVLKKQKRNGEDDITPKKKKRDLPDRVVSEDNAEDKNISESVDETQSDEPDAR
ncbi:MAG TPA: hypothetical protein VJG83_05840 [archaeon]|nr:hypothetical protein [archaeon]